jgi:sulfur-carrier protein adenylyltransferase/sulfurtransferase
MWYLTDIPRYKAEKDSIRALASQEGQIHPVNWRMSDRGRLILDVDIVVGNRTFEAFLQYPAQYPELPPSIYPRDEKSRWSNHQYGAGGELCLEYRPDNWTTDLTGADMLASAYRLLSTENPTEGPAVVARSAHEESLGQSLRTDYLRFVHTRRLDDFLASLAVGQKLQANILVHYRSECAVYLVDKVTKADGEIWKNPDVPDGLGSETYERTISVMRVAEDAPLPPTTGAPEFHVAAEALGFGADEKSMIILRGGGVHCFLLNDKTVFKFSAIPAETEMPRVDESHAVLRGKSVTLVGCGSLGSKIATSLARAGVADFFLVDDDVLLPDNMVRNDLDWRDVGVHKARALANRIKNVSPAAQVHVRCFRFAGQEASESAETALASLLRRDLVIDATANPSVFNLLSSVVEKKKKSMVWGEVFGGGFGGLIARYRPDIEPPPVLMRRAIENWFGERDYRPERTGRDYATGGDGPPMVADDADVASIAAATTRLAIDVLIGRDPSYFPSSVYAIGLAPEPGLFTQAFETFPLEMPPPPMPAPAAELTPEEIQVEAEEIIKLISAI